MSNDPGWGTYQPYPYVVQSTPPRTRPLWKRVLMVLMRIVGWIILIPSALALIASALFTAISSITWNPLDFVIWSVITSACAGLTALGVLMTGVVKDKE